MKIEPTLRRSAQLVASFTLAGFILAGCGGGAGNTAAPQATSSEAVQNVVTGSTVTLDGSSVTTADGMQTYHWTLESKPANSNASLTDPAVPTPSFTADQSGTYIAKLVTGNGASTRVTIMAGVGNVAPVAHAGADQNVTTGTLITLNGSASSDANGDALTYRWWFISKPAGSGATLTAAATAAPTFSADVAGDYVVKLLVNDGTVDSVYATVTIVATAGTNAAPVADAGAAQSVIAGANVVLDGSASSDANGDPLTYQWGFLYRPAGSTAWVNPSTSATPSFAPDQPGIYVARLVVNDGAISSVPATVAINVAAGNAPPVAVAGADQNVSTGTLVTLDGSASSDANGDPLTYQWALISTPAGSTAALKNAATAAPTFSADLAGTYVAKLLVKDGKVYSAAAVVIITATAGNAVPVANAGATQYVSAGDLVTLNGNASNDANGDPLSFQWTLVAKPVGSAAALTGKTTATPTFTADRDGTYVASLVVRDGAVNSAASTVVIKAGISMAPWTEVIDPTVPNGGIAYQALAIPDYGVTAIQTPSMQFDSGNVSFYYKVDSESGYDFLRFSIDGVEVLAASGNVAWTLASFPITAGAHTLRWAYTKDRGYVSGLDTAWISQISYPLAAPVTNIAPVANAGVAQSVSAGAAVTLNGSASSDADGDPLSYSWTLTTAPAGSGATLANPTSANPTFTADTSGTYVATLVVNDGTANSVASTVTITTGAPVGYPAGYVAQGGLVWTPDNLSFGPYAGRYDLNWADATAYCANFSVNGVTGWRLPTLLELNALYASGAMNGQGWIVDGTWSSTQLNAGIHHIFYLNLGYSLGHYDTNIAFMSCVH